MAEWQKLVFLAAFGAAGTLARYGLDAVVQRTLGNRFPWGILIVNVLGCFLFGLVAAMGQRQGVSMEVRLLLLTGFLGAFTTFSTFVFQTNEYLRSPHWGWGGVNIIVQIGLGLVALSLGIALGRRS